MSCFLSLGINLIILFSAALKCRQRKKAWLAQLNAKVEFLAQENDQLKSALVAAREEISRLSALVGSAAIGGHGGHAHQQHSHQNGSTQHSSSHQSAQSGSAMNGHQPVSMSVSLKSSSASGPTGPGAGSAAPTSTSIPVSVGGKGAYGY